MKTLSSLLVALVALTTIASATGTITGFYYEPGKAKSYIAGYNTVGGTLLLDDHPDWIFYAGHPSYEGWNATTFSISSPTLSQHWTLSIMMAHDAPFQIGSFVSTRFPFNADTVPGFDWSGNGRGSNTSTTYFDIREVKYTEGKISSLAVDFIQFEETWGRTENLSLEKDRGAFGSYRYNSTIPIVPEASVFGLWVVGVLGFLRRRRN